MIEVNNISKSFGDIQALKSVDFSINDGELFGLIGPDGAGKTTLFRILTTLLLPDKGSASVKNLDVVLNFKKIRRIVGYMPGKFSLYQDLSVEENLNFFATIFNTSLLKNYDVIKDIYIQIETFKKRRAGKLSGGMKQKLALCCALIHNPSILFLDEPTTGVDAVSRQEFWQMLLQLKKRGKTIVVSTPYMDEAALCDRIALIDKGQILAVDPPGETIKYFTNPLYSVYCKDYYRCLILLRSYRKISRVLPFGASIHVTAVEELDLNDLLHFLNSHGHDEVKIQKIVPSVEDVFLHLLSRPAHEV